MHELIPMKVEHRKQIYLSSKVRTRLSILQRVRVFKVEEKSNPFKRKKEGLDLHCSNALDSRGEICIVRRDL